MLVSADASADACPAPIAVTRWEGDGETLVATLGREAPCAPIEAPLMRRVALSGIRLEVESSHGASDRDARAIEARTNGGGSTTRMPTTKADGKQETASTDDSEVPEEAKRRKSVVPDREEISGDKSLCLFSWKNPVRRTAAKLVWHPFFDNFIVVLILVSSLLLAVEWPGWWTSSPQMVVLMVFDRIFTVLFTLEMLLKIVVLGFVRSKTPQYPAYLRSVWNVPGDSFLWGRARWRDSIL